MDTTKNTNGHVKLYRLKIEDIFGVKSAELDLNGASAMLIGKNEAGKTSIIDAIKLSIGQHKDGNPLRRGERKGEIVAEFDQFEVIRTWKDKGSPKWEVKDKEGGRFGSAKELFDGFIDSIAVNPDSIIRMGGTDRARAVCKAAGIDIDDFNEKRKEIYDERSAINRMVKEADAKLTGLGKPGKDVPDNEVDISALSQELKSLKEKQKAREDIELDLQSVDRNMNNIKEEIESYELKLKNLRNSLENFEKQRENVIEKLENAENYEYQIESVHQKLQAAGAINAQVHSKLRYIEAKAEYERYSEESQEKTDALNEHDRMLRDKLNGAGLVEGLVVEKDDIYLNDIKFDRLSRFQQLDLAMRIGMNIKSANKDGLSTKILCIDASPYDEENWPKIVELAEKHGFTVIIEIPRKIHRDENGNLRVPDDIKAVKDIKKFYIEEGYAEELVEN